MAQIFLLKFGRKVRTAECRVPAERLGIKPQGLMTVRATETSPDLSGVKRAILPAATDELHHNVSTGFFGDNDAGIDRS